MNIRTTQKRKRIIQLTLLKIAVEELDENQKRNYKVSLRKYPFADLVTIGRMNNNIKFEVRENEGHHNVAHFHVTIRGKGSASFRIDNLETIESDLSLSDEKEIRKWALRHRDLLIDTWNQFHGYRITVA